MDSYYLTNVIVWGWNVAWDRPNSQHCYVLVYEKENSCSNPWLSYEGGIGREHLEFDVVPNLVRYIDLRQFIYHRRAGRRRWDPWPTQAETSHCPTLSSCEGGKVLQRENTTAAYFLQLSFIPIGTRWSSPVFLLRRGGRRDESLVPSADRTGRH